MDPHVPFQAPYPFNRESASMNVDFVYGIPEMLDLDNRREPLPETTMDFIIKSYDEEIEYVDAQIGIIMNSLVQSNVFQNTLIILSADHGEGLGDHNYYTHKSMIYEEQVKVPLIIKYPGTEHIKKTISCPFMPGLNPRYRSNNP
jgi:uncharacterized sulfatase